MQENLIKRTVLVGCVSALLAAMAVLAGCSGEDAYPTKAIELVVSLPPGGGSDLGARVVAKGLAKELGVPVNVVNKPGGNQVTGVKSVMDAPKDGYTLVADGASQSSLFSLQKAVPFKIEERTFIARVMTAAHGIAVPGNSPYKTLKELTDAVKAKPEDFMWGWSGASTTSDFVSLQLLHEAGIDINKTKRVPINGSGKMVTAVAGNHIHLATGGAAAFFAMAKSGNVRVLAVTGDKRMEQLSDVPTTTEAGFPKVNLDWWIGISGPAGLPKNVVDRLTKACEKIAKDPEVIKELVNIGAYPNYIGPAQIREHVVKEIEMFKMLAAQVIGE